MTGYDENAGVHSRGRDALSTRDTDGITPRRLITFVRLEFQWLRAIFTNHDDTRSRMS